MLPPIETDLSPFSPHPPRFSPETLATATPSHSLSLPSPHLHAAAPISFPRRPFSFPHRSAHLHAAPPPPPLLLPLFTPFPRRSPHLHTAAAAIPSPSLCHSLPSPHLHAAPFLLPWIHLMWRYVVVECWLACIVSWCLNEKGEINHFGVWIYWMSHVLH